MKKHIKKLFLLVISLLFLIIIFTYLFFLISDYMNKNKSSQIYGVSFNPQYARELGLNPVAVFDTILKEWNFKNIRLSAQWDLGEPKEGEFNFDELDLLMNMAKDNDAKIVLAVGRKTPRWPECHLPSWASEMSYEEYRPYLLRYIKAVVMRYDNHPALEIWQVENEPFLNYGACGKMSTKDYDEEVKLVKGLDKNHKIITTDSGELSLWRKSAQASDLFGTTMYRVVWNKHFGFFNYYWLPSGWYNLRLKLNSREIEDAYVMELQAEPWMTEGSATSTPITDQLKSLDVEKLEKNITYAKKTGWPRVYLWGAEWWYLAREQGRGEFAEVIKELMK